MGRVPGGPDSFLTVPGSPGAIPPRGREKNCGNRHSAGGGWMNPRIEADDRGYDPFPPIAQPQRIDLAALPAGGERSGGAVGYRLARHADCLMRQNRSSKSNFDVNQREFSEWRRACQRAFPLAPAALELRARAKGGRPFPRRRLANSSDTPSGGRKFH